MGAREKQCHSIFNSISSIPYLSTTVIEAEVPGAVAIHSPILLITPIIDLHEILLHETDYQGDNGVRQFRSHRLGPPLPPDSAAPMRYLPTTNCVYRPFCWQVCTVRQGDIEANFQFPTGAWYWPKPN
jgi:hypothetical protein